MGDPYAVLGVTRTATDDEITQAYRRLARKYHPDLNPGNHAAEEKMKEVNGAYEAIKEIRSSGGTTDNRYGASWQGSYGGGSAYGWQTYGYQSHFGGTAGYSRQSAYQSRARRLVSLFKIILYFNLAQLLLSLLLRGLSLIGGYGFGSGYQDEFYRSPPYEYSQWYQPEE